MRIKNLDLIVAILIVVVNVGWTQVPNRPILVGVILALPLVFILPGYMLIQTLSCERFPVPPFARKLGYGSVGMEPAPVRVPTSPVPSPHAILLSLGLSIALDIVVGFVLNLFPFGLQDAVMDVSTRTCRSCLWVANGHPATK